MGSYHLPKSTEVYPDMMVLGGAVYKPNSRMVTYANHTVVLSPTESIILYAMACNIGSVFPVSCFCSLVYGRHYPVGKKKVMAVMVCDLRDKLRRIDAHGLVRSVRGYGYCLHPLPELPPLSVTTAALAPAAEVRYG